MVRIKLAQLKRALAFGGRIDASGMVLNGDQKPVYSTEGDGAHRPAYLTSGHRDERFGTPTVDRGGRLNIRDFERLSLAARTAMMIAHTPDGIANPGSLRAAARAADLNLDAFPVVDPQDILKALAWVADELGPDQGAGGSVVTEQQLAMRGGLQLIGCRIRPLGSFKDGIRLINARQPISLRLIGCVVECPVLLSHCKLVSLDLSGSALMGLDATGLEASGSIHLRRTFIQSQASFAGAKVAGIFNASDAVIAPFQIEPDQLPIDPDHGMLNLSKATIENELRLSRTRIWGGLSLRGAKVGRSVFLSEAVLSSPIGLLERECRDDVAVEDTPESMLLRQVLWADSLTAERLHSPFLPDRAEGLGDEGKAFPGQCTALRTMEIAEGIGTRWRDGSQHHPRQLSARGWGMAVRADGLEVGGTLFARGMTVNGIFRMKYAIVAGSVRLEGSVFRSTATIKKALEDRDAKSLDWSPKFRREWDKEIPGVALDLRDSRVAGQVSLGATLGWKQSPKDSNLAGLLGTIRRVGLALDQDDSGEAFPDRPAEYRDLKYRSRWRPTDLVGRARLEGLRVDGSLKIVGLRVWNERHETEANKIENPPEPRSIGWYSKTLFRLKSSSPGSISDQEVEEGKAADAMEPGPELAGEEAMERDDPWGRKPVLDLRQIKVGRDLVFNGMVGVGDLALENAEIGGDLKFSEKSSGRTRDGMQGLVSCKDRVLDLHGVLNLKAVRVHGDVHLVFDPDQGPTILANMARIGGRLDIYPAVGTQSYITADHREVLYSGFWLDDCKHKHEDEPDGEGVIRCKLCRVTLAAPHGRKSPHIDLRLARASVFTHPPQAWPEPGAISLDGFGYEQTSELGPLAPSTSLRTSAADRREFEFKVMRRPRLMAALRLVMVGLMMAVAVGASWLLWSALQPVSPVVGRVEWGWLGLSIGCTQIGTLFLSRRGKRWLSGVRSFLLGRPSESSKAGASASRGDSGRRRDCPWLTTAFLIALIVAVAFLPSGLLAMTHVHPALLTGHLASVGLLLGALTGWRLPAWSALPVAALSLGVFHSLAGAAIPPPSLAFAFCLLGATWLASRLMLALPPRATPRRMNSGAGRDQVEPRALEYLSRQRKSEARYKLRPSSYVVLDSYTRAAKALREGGRYISANRVEEERLRLRTRMLSWRHHGAAKLMLCLVDLFAGYGFRLSRAVAIVALSLCLIGGLAHFAASQSFLVPAPEPMSQAGLEPRAKPDERAVCGSDPGGRTLEQDCPDLTYAADLILPFIELGQASKWEPAIPEGEAVDKLSTLPEPLQSVLVGLILTWPTLVAALGLLLCAVIATAVAARVESAYARVEE